MACQKRFLLVVVFADTIVARTSKRFRVIELSVMHETNLVQTLEGLGKRIRDKLDDLHLIFI